MLSIDRASPLPVADQLTEQIRYRIASGRYRVGQSLPSTRAAAQQLGISFHTVRKAYQRLEVEGLLEGRQGSGFVVARPPALGKADRMERGAHLVNQVLHQLAGLGLEEEEIEALFNEQLDLLGEAQGDVRIVFAGPSLELAELYAKQIEPVVQHTIDVMAVDELNGHLDADVLLAPCGSLRAVMDRAPAVDARCVATSLNVEALEKLARLLPHQSVGIVVREAGSVQPLIHDIRHQSGFEGALLAACLESGSIRVEDFARQVDLLLYTPACRRSITGTAAGTKARAQFHPVILKESLDALAAAIPAQP